MKLSILTVLALTSTAFATTNGTSDPIVNDGQTVQDLRKPCDCPPANCPPFLTEKAKCECEANHGVLCYKKSNGGCAEPVAVAC